MKAAGGIWSESGSLAGEGHNSLLSFLCSMPYWRLSQSMNRAVENGWKIKDPWPYIRFARVCVFGSCNQNESRIAVFTISFSNGLQHQLVGARERWRLSFWEIKDLQYFSSTITFGKSKFHCKYLRKNFQLSFLQAAVPLLAVMADCAVEGGPRRTHNFLR